MESGRWKAGGHSFRTKAEYEAALRDLEKIRLLKEKTNYSKKESILELYNRMQTGSISFETVLGREFDDEVYEQVRRIRAGQFEEVGKSRQPVRNNRISEKSLKKKRQKPPGVKVLTRGQYIARRIMMSVLLLIAAGCLGYFSIYCMEAVKKDREQQQMAKLKENTKLNAMGKDEVVVHLDTEEKSYVVLEKYKNLYKTNKNLIGWLKIDDTNIDYPVMQTVNNEYYLDHNTKQEKDKNGTLFLYNHFAIYQNYLLVLRDLSYWDNKMLLYPYGGIEPQERIVIYGAGGMGQSLHSYCRGHNIMVVSWVDRNYTYYQSDGLPVISFDEFQDRNEEWDYIFIANTNEQIAMGIKKQLTTEGIEEKKIRWFSPQFLNGE